MNLNDLFAAANQQVIAPATSADELNAAAATPAPPDVSGLMTQQNPSLPVTPGVAPQKGSPLKNMLRNFMSGFGEGMTNAAGLETPEQKQARQVENVYKQALTAAQLNNIEQSKPIVIPDNVADETGLPRGTAIPKSDYGQIVSAYLRMKSVANKPTPQADKQRYMGLLTQQNQGQPISPDDQAWMKAFKDTSTMTAVEGAKARAEGFGNIKVKTLWDTKTGQLIGKNANEWNAANASEPGRFIDPTTSMDFLRASSQARGFGSLATRTLQVPDGEGGTYTTTALDALRNRLPAVGNLNFERILNKKVQMDDVVGAFNTLKQYTHVLNNGHNAQISAAIADPEHTLTQYAQSGAIGNLNEDEKNYVVNLLMAREAAGSMRQILGTGQSSDMNRRLILATLPGANTPDGSYADKQVDAALGILNRLAPSVPKGVASRGSNVPDKLRSKLPGNNKSGDPLGIR